MNIDMCYGPMELKGMNTVNLPRQDIARRLTDEESDFHSQVATPLAERFQSLADPTRLVILHLLMTRGPMCVCEIMVVLQLTQSNASFHLITLRRAGLIKAHKVGKWVFYDLDRESVRSLERDFNREFDFEKWPVKAEPVPSSYKFCEKNDTDWQAEVEVAHNDERNEK